jgi:putative two-component system hydrogenase maturation factor HypX/HoxX
VRILLLASAFNGLTQRISRELQLQQHVISVELAIDAATMEEAVALFNPELIVCPFLKQRIPDSIWKHHACLVVHPGIEGDRGPSSLDWAITNGDAQWGVTVLQAAEKMDAGDIWGTVQFPLRKAPKASIYRREITEQAVQLVLKAVRDFASGHFQPRKLDYGNVHVTGRWNRPMQQEDRRINWSADTTADILDKLNAAEGSPGILDTIGTESFYLYGATRAVGLKGAPGDFIAQHHGAVCRATIDGAIWISHLKVRDPNRKTLKLPAMQLLGDDYRKLKMLDTDALNSKEMGCNEIRYREAGDVGYLYFDFYNGAMNTEQCERLRRVLVRVKQRPIKVIVLMGGEEFWSNGIHLNCIEAAAMPADESWRNINAINDIVREIITADKQLTVAALRNNAGAGGAVMAAACDYVLARSGTVLNVHYRSMGLHGSEYWTYVLPRRVGVNMAGQLTEDCLPTLAAEAHVMGLVNHLLPESWDTYHVELESLCKGLAAKTEWKKRIAMKQKERARDEKIKPLQAYREEELRHMRATFFNPHSEFHQARHDFVYKQAAASTPLRIAAHRRGIEQRRSA